MESQKTTVSSGGSVSWYSGVIPKSNKNNELLKQYKANGQKLNVIDDLGQDLRGGSFKYCNFKNADFAGVYASLGDFRGSDFKGADLGGADFTLTNLAGCDFRNADLRGCDFRGANLSGADLRGAKIDGIIIGYIKNHATRLTGMIGYDNEISALEIALNKSIVRKKAMKSASRKKAVKKAKKSATKQKAVKKSIKTIRKAK